MNGPPGQVAFLFDELRLDHDRMPREDWEILLWILGNFSVIVQGREVYAESEFCVVEFAAAVSAWLKQTARPRPAFEYVSMEAEERGLVWIKKVGDAWQLGAFHQSSPALPGFSWAEIEAAAAAFLHALHHAVLTRFQIDIRGVLDRG